jgi:uncharacterized protein YjiK
MPKTLPFIICNLLLYVIYSFQPLGQSSSKYIYLKNNSEKKSQGVVKITRTWELPPILNEISGIDFVDSVRVACIQDEIGTIFIFNLETDTIEKEIPFGPPGDYEALAIVNEDVYVACADGRLFEILNYSTNPVAKEYGTHLTVKQNLEGLCYDTKNKRLLVAIKGKEEENQLYKGIYSFDLVTKKMPVKPIYKIDLMDSVFGKQSIKKAATAIQPSDITIQPQTNEIYILDATRPQMLLLNNSGQIKYLQQLNKEEFIQPEAITFNAQGEMFIASEGNKHQPAKLMLVEFK